MKREEIVKRVNQRLDGRMYSWDEMKYEFDDAIVEINGTMQTIFPFFTDIMLDGNSRYVYYVLNFEKELPIVFKNEIDMEDHIRRNTLSNRQYTKQTKEVFPGFYLRSIVIPYVVMRMLQREDEYGNLQSTMMQEYQRGIQTMFTEYYSHVPDYFIREDGDMETYMNHGHDNPFQIRNNDLKGPLDQ